MGRHCKVICEPLHWISLALERSTVQAVGAPLARGLFASGDAGWSGEVVEMARALGRALDTLVVGVHITRYLTQLGASWDQELYPEADFEALSQFTQKLGLPS